MATVTAGMSLDQFLATHFKAPEPDFVDGEVIERSTPDSMHAGLQARLAAFISRTPGLTPYSELRVNVAERSYIIDLCAYRAEENLPRFPSTPPVVAVEILSMDDRFRDVLGKLTAYRNWGVAHVWLIDPYLPQLNEYNEKGLVIVPALEIPEYSFRIGLEDLVAHHETPAS